MAFLARTSTTNCVVNSLLVTMHVTTECTPPFQLYRSLLPLTVLLWDMLWHHQGSNSFNVSLQGPTHNIELISKLKGFSRKLEIWTHKVQMERCGMGTFHYPIQFRFLIINISAYNHESAPDSWFFSAFK